MNTEPHIMHKLVTFIDEGREALENLEEEMSAILQKEKERDLKSEMHLMQRS